MADIDVYKGRVFILDREDGGIESWHLIVTIK
jgi:hypothetical protein